MEFPRRPLRPLLSGLAAVQGRLLDLRLWAPFLALGALKGLLLLGVARLDRIPAFLLRPTLEAVPGLERHLHYPQLVLRLPEIASAVDLLFFLSLGAIVQGIATLRFARAWGVTVSPLGANPGRAVRAGGALVAIAALLVLIPFLAVQAALLLGQRGAALPVGLCAGWIVSMLLFVAPAFLLVRGLSFRASLAASAAMLPRLPVALPLAVLMIAALHAPALVLRAPAIRAGAANDPDWILGALLGQLPADVVGAVLSAGLGAYFALRTQVRGATNQRLVARAAALAVLVLLGGLACGPGMPSPVAVRYECERWVERGRLRAAALEEADELPDAEAWLEVAGLYGRAFDRLGLEVLSPATSDPIERDLGRLACKALLGRARATMRAQRTDEALRDYRTVLEVAVSYRGARGDAALGLAQCADGAGRWRDAYAGYRHWMRGVRDGDWPLHADGVGVPEYVARRLRNRGERREREAWIDSAAAALNAAASRGELARNARTARFGMLLAAQRWNDAYAALNVLRTVHDPEGRDGALVVAQASLLAGGLGREQEALGLLAGLAAEKSAYDTEHRVAGFLLLGQIQVRCGDLATAKRAYESALAAARSDAGRSEAVLGLARVAAARGDLEGSRRYYTQLRDLYAATPAGLLAPLEEIHLLLRERAEADAQALLPVALQGYRTVIRRFGTELPALLAARYTSQAMGLGGHWGHGIAFLDSIAPTFGKDPRAGSLLVQAARIAVEQLDDPERAEVLLERVHARYPDSDVAVFAQSYGDSVGLRAPTP